MKENVGRIDRIARAVVGPALIAVGFGPLRGRRGCWQGLLAMLTGALITQTVVTSVCPLNKLLGLDTRSPLERERADREAVAKIRERDANAAFATAPPADIEELGDLPGTVIIDTPAG